MLAEGCSYPCTKGTGGFCVHVNRYFRVTVLLYGVKHHGKYVHEHDV